MNLPRRKAAFVFCFRYFWPRLNLHKRDNPKTATHATASNPRHHTPDAHTAPAKATPAMRHRASPTMKRQCLPIASKRKNTRATPRKQNAFQKTGLEKQGDTRNFQPVILYLNFGYTWQRDGVLRCQKVSKNDAFRFTSLHLAATLYPF